jgi:ABC-2 type transport system permease protein
MKEILRAAFVIARRDFTAIIFSKAFIFFLLGPLFPLIVGVAAGSLGGKIAEDSTRPVIGIAMDAESTAKMAETRKALTAQLGDRWFPELKSLAPLGSKGGSDPESYLADKKNNLAAVVSGTLKAPVLTATPGAADDYDDEIRLLAGYAASGQSAALPELQVNKVEKSAGNAKQVRILTGQAAQVLIFMLTMLLAGMVLSNLVEEKANKIIEILAASIPMESVFLGKLFAMLAMSFLGIIVWASVGIGLTLLAGGAALPNLPTPAVGWPVFAALCVLYFTLAYLMLGALFLGIGAMAATVREVQTLSMPVTMLQLINFFFASYTVTQLDKPIEKAAAIFPFSSPFAMIARAAQDPNLWYHGVAIFGQIFFAILLLRLGVYLFKRNVMKSGSGGKIKDDGGKRKLFGIIPMPG